MLLETLDLNIDPRLLHLALGLMLGAIFGVAAQISRFCLRRAVAGEAGERTSAGAVWVTGLAAAILGVWAARSLGLIILEDHRFLSPTLPVAAVLIGGLAFGAGAVLTRGCVSRLTVLTASGNLRALFVLAAFAIAAHATLKGVLAPLRTALGRVTIDTPFGAFSDTSPGLPLLAAGAVILAAYLIWQSRPRVLHLALGAVIGLVAVAGWAGTSVLLFDEFAPLPVQSAAFTAPWSDSIFWLIASTAVPAGFGVGFIGGVLGGAFFSATLRGEWQLQSFSSPQETLRYLAGGILMGIGGVLAGGCTIGAGLSGTATGSLAALLSLAAIVAGAALTARLLRGAQLAPAAA